MKILYFAWLRERLNRASDEVDPPPEVVTLADLVTWLRQNDEALDMAMENPAIFKLSIDAHIRPWDTPITGAREVAILPPMTGG
ncbi:MoaD/ThiS family protein [Devosia sp. 63-57]|uniref:MoaD/ThiS family protein n=1 Tax=Devosia sp. 63-57 TaxID=1895751 RepID=UPI000869CE27|nr:MoaD/ThiS family protein [Devosia sp. 63-57]ODT49610.1 MAG: molybdopterin synthase sulfur carrier subunit [Pelagibacterium sp. SCN 63-126]ODU87624.1 MAG: molybdopterin synthase sulfur carrier subunit [Pelagibacterium sp. SCN 63-17]OJX45625.1 MAG: molybdopterin synthase sulfur carrier subunit [Devosia sp. 63-57]